MASSIPSTPSPPGRIHTPNTPKFGYGDSWEPYSPRKSARISAQRSAQRTPSPQQPRSRASTRNSSCDYFPSAFTTPQKKQKKRLPAMDSVRRASGAINFADGTKSDAAGSSNQKSKATTASRANAAMLPTPAKTPQKQPDEKAKAKVRAVARNLFSDDVDVTPKKKAKKYTGLTLDSFTAEDVEEDIEIFTDSRDRIPEKDQDEENPFYQEEATAAEPATPIRRDTSKLVSVPGERKQTLEESLEREDGFVYVFRGKKFFRRLADEEDPDEMNESEEEAINAELGIAKKASRGSHPKRSLKPRLLFPSKKEVAAATKEDEEAVTDIEDHVIEDADINEATEVVEEDIEEPAAPATPVRQAGKKPQTPVAPRFAPASPPSTVRATRASTKLQAHPTPTKQSKQRSPFDGWRRSKSRASQQGQKRGATSPAPSDEASKRQRV
ncbi:hypothetical protein M426DRAFT_23570 [Hypoxylon sp. CI-4A]|nr:hypothetical protein M426DRAFT_23570 [Hypoxylon sp. CI-4A]